MNQPIPEYDSPFYNESRNIGLDVTEEISGIRRNLRSHPSCAMALEGLTLALEAHVNKTAALEKEFALLDRQYQVAKERAGKRAERAKRKDIPLRIRSLAKSKEQLRRYRSVREELSSEIQDILFFRELLRVQIQDTIDFGHRALAEGYEAKLSTLHTPMEQIAMAEPEAIVEHDPMLIAMWQAVRERIDALFKHSQGLLLAMEKHLYKPDPRQRFAVGIE